MQGFDELSREVLRLIVSRGESGIVREDIYTDVKGVKYGDVEERVRLLEDLGLVEIDWLGPSDFVARPTIEGIEIIYED